MAELYPHVSHLSFTLSDEEFQQFEQNYFLTGTDNGGESADFIQFSRVRLPKIKVGQKSVIDYSKLDKATHSKIEILAKIPHDTEVMKARMCPKKQGLIAAVNNQGLVNLYQLNGITKGAQAAHVACLYGLKEETFCLNWS